MNPALVNFVLLLVWEVTCGALLWSVFTRSVLIGPDARCDIRLALLLCGAASLLGLAAPLYGWQPSLIACMVLGANVIWQLVVGRHWAEFVAYQIFSKDDPDDPDDSEPYDPITHPFHDFEPDMSSGTARALRAAIYDNEKT